MAYQFLEQDYGISVDAIPAMHLVPEETMRLNLACLKAYGFKQEDIRSIVKKFPAVLGCTAERTNSLLANLESYGFKQEDIRSIVKKLPQVLDCTAKRTTAGLHVFSDMGFDIRNKPSMFMFSPVLLRGRLNFLRNANLVPDTKIMFLSNRQFEDRFKITRAELILLA